MAITTLEIDDKLKDQKNFTGLSYRALIELGIKSLNTQRESNERMADLEDSNEKLNKVIARLQQQLWDIQDQQKNKQPIEEH